MLFTSVDRTGERVNNGYIVYIGSYYNFTIWPAANEGLLPGRSGYHSYNALSNKALSVDVNL